MRGMFATAEEEILRLTTCLAALENTVNAQAATLAHLLARVAALEHGVELPPTDPPDPPPGITTGVWLSPDEIAALPMSGAEWASVKKTADAASDKGANVADMNEDQDITILAVALVAARTGDAAYRGRAIKMLIASIGSEKNAGADFLAFGRNLTALIIAADLLGIREGAIYDWLAGFMTRRFSDDHHTNKTLPDVAWASGSNASSQEGAVYAALAVYTGNKAALADSWDGFRRFCGDRTSPRTMTANAWAQPFLEGVNKSDPVGILPKGTTVNGCTVDGAVPNDVARENGTPCEPKYTYYGNTGAQGWVPAAVLFHRQGYKAFEIQDQAIKRAYLYWKHLAKDDPQWDDPKKSPEIRHLLKWAYRDLDIEIVYPTGADRTVGFTGWTHPI